tara:strand:+ start:11441 stop:11806 length:366 start_codon:yes stop_codon:yes gene_type:complete
MSIPRRLFNSELTTVSTDLTVAEHMYTAPNGGPTMVTGVFIAASQGATNNEVRLHHLQPVNEETPASKNIILRVTVSNAHTPEQQFSSVKIIMQPGERLYGNLHAGTAVAVSAYGLEPRGA